MSLALMAMIAGNAAMAATPPSQAEFARYADELLKRNYRADAPGAAVLVARGDSVLFRAARGLATMDAHAPLRPDSRFPIASVAKQFTAAGLLELVDAGKVGLDHALSKYVKDYPGGDRITLRQLLNHTAGVRNYNGLPGYIDSLSRRDMTTAQLIDLFRHEKPDFAPGSGWAYSNSNYVLIGAVIEAVSGKPWHAYLDQALFKPLGMKHTGYALDPAMSAGQVRGHGYRGDSIVPARAMSMTQPNAAGALVSNVDDLFRWCRALHGGRVLASATYTQMITPAGKAADPVAAYGFGLYVDRVRTARALRHGGGMFGFFASVTYLPGPDVTVVVLENDDAPNAPDDIHTVVRKLAAMALGDPYPEVPSGTADTVAVQLPRAALERLVGQFAKARLMLDVFLEGDALKARLAGQDPVGLRAVSPTRFIVEPTGATLVFSAGDEPPVEVTVRQGGREVVLDRVPRNP